MCSDAAVQLLEIPQLMDTCVRNGNYEEALQLEAYVQKLTKLYPNIRVLQQIVRPRPYH
jgi:hypothetical protein